MKTPIFTHTMIFRYHKLCFYYIINNYEKAPHRKFNYHRSSKDNTYREKRMTKKGHVLLFNWLYFQK